LDSDYHDREQTGAKHFILKNYLESLAYKVLSSWDTLTYIDGFSGPWESRAPDFSDTSFMIAIKVLKEVQNRLSESGKVKKIQCYFSEKNPKAYKSLAEAIKGHENNNFEIQTYCGQFEDAIPEIVRFADKRAFKLIFIDPTGWGGYPFTKISPLFRDRSCEVLVNFMYDFINRFIHRLRTY